MAQLPLSNPTIPQGSTILVTGANGLIASHIVDQFLARGYNVRGTVRNLEKSAWLRPFFASRHPSNHLELLQVSDFGAPGAWDTAVQGVSGICHVAGGANLSVKDIDKELEKELPWNESLLQAAKNEPSVKSFAYTTSAWAAWTPDPSKKIKLTEWSWNDEAIQVARSDAPPEEKGIKPFMAFKTLLEQRLWDWVKREKPAFAFNSILPETVIGEVLDPKNQGFPSTCGMVKWIFDKTNLEIFRGIPPQWHIDTHDTGLLYVAALITPGVNEERLFGFGDRYSWPKVAEILKQLYPQKDIPTLEDMGWDQTEVPNERALELLRGLGQSRWTTLEESVKALAKSFTDPEQQGAESKVNIL